MTGNAGVAGALSVAYEDGSHLALYVSPLHSRNDRRFRFGLRASGQGRAVPVPTEAEGSLDAKLAETILAASGMEGDPVSYLVGLFSVCGSRYQGVGAFAGDLRGNASPKRLQCLLGAFPLDWPRLQLLAAIARQPQTLLGKFWLLQLSLLFHDSSPASRDVVFVFLRAVVVQHAKAVTIPGHALVPLSSF